MESYHLAGWDQTSRCAHRVVRSHVSSHPWDAELHAKHRMLRLRDANFSLQVLKNRGCKIMGGRPTQNQSSVSIYRFQVIDQSLSNLPDIPKPKCSGFLVDHSRDSTTQVLNFAEFRASTFVFKHGFAITYAKVCVEVRTFLAISSVGIRNPDCKALIFLCAMSTFRKKFIECEESPNVSHFMNLPKKFVYLSNVRGNCAS